MQCNFVVAGWLQPLLSRVAENRTVVAVPVMDVIDDTTFEYKFFDAQSINIGGFDWSLQFTWIGISDREKQRRPSHISPVRYGETVLLACRFQQSWSISSDDLPVVLRCICICFFNS